MSIRKLFNTISKNTFPKDLHSVFSKDVNDCYFYGMNGQFIKASIVINLLRELPFDYFVETGTNTGATSFLIASQCRQKVLTTEINPKFYYKARRNLFPYLILNKVRTSFKDSPSFLAETMKRGLIRNPFIYLDAHWEEELPLRDEINLILKGLTDFVIMIDDFSVPFDKGFRADPTYGITLNFDYIRDILVGKKLKVYFPGYSSQLETGSKCGWILLASVNNALKIEKIVPASLIKTFDE